MRIALIADVHGNREAFDAVLDALAHDSVDRIVLLGDLVGYGADPAYCLDRAAGLVAHGALAVMGNHDAAALSGQAGGFNDYAREAIAWTRRTLEERHRAFLSVLPMTLVDGERLYVHASPVDPANWSYVADAAAAERAFAAVPQRVILCGHHHRPAIYSQTPDQAALGFAPATDAPIPLLARRRWLAVIGACGQPRDENPSASYAVLDEGTRSLCLRRAPYDIESAARKIQAAGLPQMLAARLFVGR
jgi:diadenosine tetraphosphatase ApaH/serine/threonine PP2A family protein phosphatase